MNSRYSAVTHAGLGMKTNTHTYTHTLHFGSSKTYCVFVVLIRKLFVHRDRAPLVLFRQLPTLQLWQL